MRCCGSRAATLLAGIDPGSSVRVARAALRRGPQLSLVALVLAGCGDDEPAEPPVRADLRAHAATTSAEGRAAILDAAERAITADARARVRRREFEGPVRRTSCKARDEDRGDVVVYSCIAIKFVGPRTSTAPPLAIGQPFQVRVEFPDRRFTWCKVSPPGGEGTGRPGRETAPPDACGGTG